MNQHLVVSAPPHINGSEVTSTLMLDVLIALTPALLAAIYLFGWRALAVTLVSVFSCLFFEGLYCRMMKRESSLFDLSAVVTGVLLAFNLPVAIPLWMPVFGAFMAIVVVKMLFGGLGMNIINPALVGRAFLANSWTADMIAWTRPVLNPAHWSTMADAVSGATPLGLLKLDTALPDSFGSREQLRNLLLGIQPGCLGETCSLLLLVGGLYLIARKVITWHIPVAYLGTVAVLCVLLPSVGVSAPLTAAYNLLGGGLMLGAFFMATDYVTSPLSNSGRLFYGVCCGLLTVFIRRFGPNAEGVSFSIMIMNLTVWFIDKLFVPRRFGGEVPQ